jgi:hypothetical protein
MYEEAERKTSEVGPVLSSGPWLLGIIDAFKELNPDLRIINRGSYCRVLAPSRLLLTREAYMRHLEGDNSWPDFLHLVMTSFVGKLLIESEKIEWLEN